MDIIIASNAALQGEHEHVAQTFRISESDQSLRPDTEPAVSGL
jgi:hypothetical protein